MINKIGKNVLKQQTRAFSLVPSYYTKRRFGKAIKFVKSRRIRRSNKKEISNIAWEFKTEGYEPVLIRHQALATGGHTYGYVYSLVIPDKGYYVPRLEWYTDKFRFYERYSKHKGWSVTTAPTPAGWVPDKTGDPNYLGWPVLPIEFKNLRWSKLFTAIIRKRADEILDLTPDEFVKLNKALQFRVQKRLLKNDFVINQLDLKDPKAVHDILWGYNKVMV